MGIIGESFLELLACPLSHAPVVESEGWVYSTDAATRRRYPIRDRLPIMLIAEGETVDEDEFKGVMARAGVVPGR